VQKLPRKDDEHKQIHNLDEKSSKERHSARRKLIHIGERPAHEVLKILNDGGVREREWIEKDCVVGLKTEPRSPWMVGRESQKWIRR
jgi:hypothetical protein